MKQSKPGRPRRTADASDVRITIRVTADERARMARAAGNLSLSDWLRDVALAAAGR
jgi:uncharacterized protein (DUF1778 family)